MTLRTYGTRTMPPMRALVAGACLVGFVTACTPGGGSDDATPPSDPTTIETPTTTPSPAETIDVRSSGMTPPGASTVGTLPLVSDHTYPTAPDAVVLQLSVDDRGLSVPLLTVYGSLEAVARTDEGWRTGGVTDFQIQDLLDEADGVGLLGDQLELRGPDLQAPADITVAVFADGIDVVHQFDLSQIERPPALRVLLSRWALSNPLGLDEPFDPASWITCTDRAGVAASEGSDRLCRVVTGQATADDRPLLPHEPDATALLP